jgi:paraquat-inducible protein B
MSEETKRASATTEPPADFPPAVVRQTNTVAAWLSQSTLLLWIVAVACLGVAIFLSVRSLSPPGEEIVVHFENGYGLKTEDQVRYRGIVVGEVEKVDLDEALHGVNVHIRLSEGAVALARAGAQFWIERPKISLGSIRGLDTIMGGRYVAVLPGPEGSAVQHEFVGTEEPPPSVDVTTGGLALLLTAENRFGLERGAPITYRGFRVGQVVTTELSADALLIEVGVVIDEPYRQLVRTNSRFWNNGGMDFKIGLRGVDVDVDTLSSLAAGGIGFATPQPVGEPVSDGHVFELAAEEVEGWQDWKPLFDMGREAIRSRWEGSDENPGIIDRIRSRIAGEPETAEMAETTDSE